MRGQGMARVIRSLVAAILLMGLACAGPGERCGQGSGKPAKRTIKVAVVTGGHAFEEQAFLSLFDGYPDIECVHKPQLDNSEIFEDISEWPYDVILLYHLTQKISPKRQANFVELLNRGVGVVALHHCICAFQDWPEYRKIIGGKFYVQDTTEKGLAHRQSQYEHNVNFVIQVQNPGHPITQGLSDFAVTDETYRACDFEPDNQVLLTTSEPSSDRPVCWVRSFRRARICYIQPGHGPEIYTNPNYRMLLARAIRWAAGPPPP